MATSTSPKKLEINPQYWQDLEVYFETIEDEWDNEYKNRFERNVEDYRIPLDVFKSYYILFDDLENFKHRFEFVVDEVGNHDPRWLIDIFAVSLYSDNKNPDIVARTFSKIEDRVSDGDTETLYNDLKNGSKMGKVAFMRVFFPEKLKDVHALQSIYRPLPKLDASSQESIAQIERNEIDRLVSKLESGQTNDYGYWHDFEHYGDYFLVIERQIGDDVERQVGENIEEHPAEFLVLTISGTNLTVYALTKPEAVRAMRYLNEIVESKFAQEVEEDENPPTDEIERHKFAEHEDTLSADQISKTISQAKKLADQTDLVLKEIKLEDSELPGSPSLTIRSDTGIQETIDWFEERNISMLEDYRNVSRIKYRFEDKDYPLLPRRKSDTDNWKLHCTTSPISDRERNRFRQQIQSVLNVEITFGKT